MHLLGTPRARTVRDRRSVDTATEGESVMKTLLTLATLMVAGATIVGCQSNRPKPQPSTPITGEALNKLRSEFMQADQNAKLGSVDAVLPSQAYLTVGQINPSQFPVGTAVVIIDSNRQVIAEGNVVRTFEETVHVHYEAKSGKRPPRVGDVAVTF
jgi:hypothetical protein